MKVKVCDMKGGEVAEVEVGFSVVENGKGTQAVHDSVVAFRAAQRSGTACAKTRGEVKASTKKPWRQKGTGRARAGSVASPIWRGGGVVFGPRPRDYAKKLNKGARRLALRKALSERLASGDVLVVETLELESPRTRDFIGVLAALQIDGTVTVVTGEVSRNLMLASRNVPHVDVSTGASLNPYDVLKNDKLVFTRGGLEQIENRLSRTSER